MSRAVKINRFQNFSGSENLLSGAKNLFDTLRTGGHESVRRSFFGSYGKKTQGEVPSSAYSSSSSRSPAVAETGSVKQMDFALLSIPASRMMADMIALRASRWTTM